MKLLSSARLYKGLSYLFLVTVFGSFCIFWLYREDNVSSRISDISHVELKRMETAEARKLEEQFLRHDYNWPPSTESIIPAVELTRLPEDLDNQVPERRKSLFFRVMLPIVLAENHRIENQRRWIEGEFAKGIIQEGSPLWRRVSEIADYYRVNGNLNNIQVRQKLLRRVDSFPVALVLAQAAKESGWGTSRFALEGNSLFGEWTYKKGAGIIPAKRGEGERHSVRAFPDLRASVRSYMYNLNVSPAYSKLRFIRELMRNAAKPLDAYTLTAGLVNYSERGMAYVREICMIIRANGLDDINQVRLASGT